MGQWTKRQYDQVLVTKIMQLFENTMTSIEADGRAPISDNRFRTFIKRLDPENKVTQQTFKALVMHGGHSSASTSNRRIYPAPGVVNTPVGAAGWSLPIHENMPIMYDGAQLSSHLRARQPGHSRSPTPIPPPPRSSGVYRPGTRHQIPDTEITGLDDPLFAEWYNFPRPRSATSSSSPPPASLSNRRINSHGIAARSIRLDHNNNQVSASSPTTAASRTWLDEYAASLPSGVNGPLRPMPQRIRPPPSPYTYPFATETETEILDNFDNLLDLPTSPGIRIGRRRRREGDDEGEERPTNRTRTGLSPSYHTDGPLDENHNAYQPWHGGLPVPMMRTEGQRARDRRRRGIVFEDNYMYGPAFDDFLHIHPGDNDQTDNETIASPRENRRIDTASLIIPSSEGSERLAESQASM